MYTFGQEFRVRTKSDKNKSRYLNSEVRGWLFWLVTLQCACVCGCCVTALVSSVTVDCLVSMVSLVNSITIDWLPWLPWLAVLPIDWLPWLPWLAVLPLIGYYSYLGYQCYHWLSNYRGYLR